MNGDYVVSLHAGNFGDVAEGFGKRKRSRIAKFFLTDWNALGNGQIVGLRRAWALGSRVCRRNGKIQQNRIEMKRKKEKMKERKLYKKTRFPKCTECSEVI